MSTIYLHLLQKCKNAREIYRKNTVENNHLADRRLPLKGLDVLNQLLSEILQYSLKAFGSRLGSVILYVSYSCSEADAESNIDVMFLLNEDAQELSSHRYALNSYGTGLDLKFGMLTSMVFQDVETFYMGKNVLPFYKNILSNGVKVVA